MGNTRNALTNIHTRTRTYLRGTANGANRKSLLRYELIPQKTGMQSPFQFSPKTNACKQTLLKAIRGRWMGEPYKRARDRINSREYILRNLHGSIEKTPNEGKRRRNLQTVITARKIFPRTHEKKKEGRGKLSRSSLVVKLRHQVVAPCSTVRPSRKNTRIVCGTDKGRSSECKVVKTVSEGKKKKRNVNTYTQTDRHTHNLSQKDKYGNITSIEGSRIAAHFDTRQFCKKPTNYYLRYFPTEIRSRIDRDAPSPDPRVNGRKSDGRSSQQRRRQRQRSLNRSALGDRTKIIPSDMCIN